MFVKGTAAAGCLLGAAMMLGVPGASAAETSAISEGQWQLTASRPAGKLHLELEAEGWSSGHDIDAGELSPPPLPGLNGEVRFVLSREAGAFECAGEGHGGAAAGHFTFTPNLAFVDALGKRGIAISSGHDLVSAAASGLTLAYIEEVAKAGYDHLRMTQLVVLRALDVTPQWLIEEQARLKDGMAVDAIAPLKALRAGPEYLDELKAAGVSGVTAREAIQLKALGVDSAFVQGLSSRGLRDLTVRQLIALKTGGA
jgi:hypothetical protein